MPAIRSAQNALLKRVAALQDPRRRRKEAALLLEGPKAILEALDAGAQVEAALLREGGAPGDPSDPLRRALDALAARRARTEDVAPSLFDAAVSTETPQGLVAIVREPARDPALLSREGPAPLVVLDRIQDPGNVGTILRTAAAMGFRGAALVEGTADPFSPKVVRAAAGTLFRLPLADVDAEGRALAGWHLVAAAEGGRPPEEALLRPLTAGARVALVLGNEGRGVSAALLARADARVWIPLARSVESLNVAAAFAMCAYAMARAEGGRAG